MQVFFMHRLNNYFGLKKLHLQKCFMILDFEIPFFLKKK